MNERFGNLADKTDDIFKVEAKAIFYIGKFHVDLLSSEGVDDYVDYQDIKDDYTRFCAATNHLDQIRQDDIYLAEYRLERDYNNHWKFELANFKTWAELDGK